MRRRYILALQGKKTLQQKHMYVFILYFPFPQPKGKKAKGKKVAPAPSVAKKHEAKKVVNPLFEKRPKNFGIGKWCSQHFAEEVPRISADDVKNICYLNYNEDIPPRSLMHLNQDAADLLFMFETLNWLYYTSYYRPGYSAQAWFDTLC